jgi:hypothetical protein
VGGGKGLAAVKKEDGYLISGKDFFCNENRKRKKVMCKNLDQTLQHGGTRIMK